jgi:DNA processing protein
MARVERIPRHDPGYPEGLAGLPSAPAALYVAGGRGRLRELLSRPVVTIAGTRHCTYYGREVAGALARDLALAGVTVLAGLTEGIEASAHHGALQAGGRTIAVVPGPPHLAYPAGQKHLHAQILKSGCVVSDMGASGHRHAPVARSPTPGARAPQRDPLLARNRLIAALVQVVVLVEATVGAAPMQTAEAALALGREVAAVPGRITDESAAGPNLLIREGAVPVLGVEDLLGLVGTGYVQTSSLKPTETDVSPMKSSRADPIPCGGGPMNSTRWASTHTPSCSRGPCDSQLADSSEPSIATMRPAYR